MRQLIATGLVLFVKTKMRKYNNSGSGKTSFMRSTGEVNSAPIDRLSQYNYPKLLSNPLVLNADVRVPDGAAMIPTCTFDVEYQFEVNPSANGVAGFFLALTGKPQLFRLGDTSTASNFVWSGSVSGATHNLVEMQVASSTVSTVPFDGLVFDYADTTLIPNQAFWDSADANYRGWRVVAAGTKVEFAGNDTQNSGIIQACQISGGFEVSNTVADPQRVNYSDASSGTSSTQNQYSEGDHYIEQVGDWNGVSLIGLAAGGTTVSSNVVGQINYLAGVAIATGQDVFQKIPIIPDVTSVDQVRTQYHAITKPAKDGIVYNWLPRSPSDFKYRRPSTNFSRAGSAKPWLTWDFNKINSSTAPVILTFPSSSQVQGPALKLLQVGEVGAGGILCVINGASTGTGATWRAKVVIHYEALPETNGNLTDGGKYAIANHQASMSAIGKLPGK